ncbi:bifunctional histidinol-phosphatase/imidazoleglycerol-phosphate dehydratase HisB [Sandaracinomonas limnophila]|uniref:Histidine biosynthesis bifunctional protein HisB n=1 Tax=Sandaracinomonas limnophila TaxID=1862386 RepID=A0A437PX53_9BACT|nr:bifunctional histidinol-phosphatase/imidazoleglycerol-phosphate dehydratase HisB [Sandaracinomonas limnophila]RVU26831.1 bifunctional histidinol-phosphatase/imidazoleglycerol-phosphate dehydratase HisB [Sandaracinomonas limnophila]
MKKILFIDRDGTIIIEPPIDFQVDSLEKLEFVPKSISNLAKIQNETDFEFVMVTNQDGLGTDSFPEETFWPAQNKMISILHSENIQFGNIHIDSSFPEENKPTRKPGTGMLSEYFGETYDLANSFVIGDRLTDLELAKNLGAKGIIIGNMEVPTNLKPYLALQTNYWDEIYFFLRVPERKIIHTRITHETQIQIELNLDGKGVCSISTGIPFFDHMLEQIGKHGSIDLTIQAKGDLHIDEHHTIEDTGIALGEAIALALGNKKGINRYGFLLPMDDCLAQVALDFGGRNWLVWEAEFKREMIGQMPTEMFYHFFKSFSDASKSNLNIKAEGENEHHKIEAIFKAFAKAIRLAVQRDLKNLDSLPSTKGIL